MNHFLERFLWPRSVAVVGAAPTGKHRTRGQLVRYLAGVGYTGRIHPVNPSYEQVDGIACHPSLEAIVDEIDVAVLALPAELIEAQLESCARAGVRHAIVLSAGFVEAGEEGAARQQRLQEIARRTGVRVCGPNCQGYYNVAGRVTTTFSPTVAPGSDAGALPVPGGAAGIIAQSGGIGYSLFARGRAAGLRFSYVVSSGNEADLTTSDFLDYMVQDPRTDVILLFCESVRDPERFVAVLAEAQRRGKPVVALKVGRSVAGQRAAASHTAALTGWDTGYRAVFQRYGVLQAEHPDDAVAIAGALASCPLPRGRRAAILTVSGGGGALMADTLTAQGLLVPELSPATQQLLRPHVPAYGSTANPVDLTLNSADLVMPALEILERSDDVDLVVLVTQLASGEILPLDPARTRAIVERRAKPVLAWTYTLPSEAGRKVAAEGGLSLAMDLRNCGRAAGALLQHAQARGALRNSTPAGERALPAARITLAEHEARRLLARHGLPSPREGLARSAAEALRLADGIGYPVALKVQSRQLPHKSDVGGVRLGLADPPSLARAFEAMQAAVARERPDARIDGFLVQAMAPRGLELVLGMVNDATFGPIMMAGLGGVAIELFGDVVHTPAPLAPADAEAMLRSLRCSALFDGFRGAPPVDLAPVAQLLARLSQLAMAERERIEEMEFNPVIVHADGSGLTVADALVVLRTGTDADAFLEQR